MGSVRQGGDDAEAFFLLYSGLDDRDANIFASGLSVVSSDPWLQRPRRLHGDPTPEAIFCSVGLALTLWETAESEISVAYAGLINSQNYRFDKYFGIGSFNTRHKLITKAINLNVNSKDCSGFGVFIDLVLKYSPRRHEIAHGRVCNIGEYGFYLAPNNVLSRNYPNGEAAYQYTSEDILFYCNQFKHLGEAASHFAKRLAQY